MHDEAVLDRGLEGGVFRSPERHEDPARAVGLFPRRQRAPDAGAGEVHFFVADERRAVDGRAVVLAAERGGVEQPDPALLAGLHGVLAAFEVEHGTGDVDVEIALSEPEGVRRRVPVDHLHCLGRRVLLGGDDGLAVDLLRGEVVAVAAARVHASVFSDRGPRRGQSPPLPGLKLPTFFVARSKL